MISSCKSLFGRLVEYIDGAPDIELESHAAQCPTCTAQANWLRNVRSAGAIELWEAPQSVQEAAHRIMVQPARQRARVVSISNPTLAVRGAAEEVHMRFELESASVRILLVPEGENWRVVGRAEPEDAAVVRDLEILPVDHGGRFEFLANGLNDTGFAIAVDGIWIEIPSAEQALKNESR